MKLFKYITIISLIIFILSVALFIREKQIEIAIHDQFVESLQTEGESNDDLEPSEQPGIEMDDEALEQLSDGDNKKNFFLVIIAFSSLIVTIFSGFMWYRIRKRVA